MSFVDPLDPGNVVKAAQVEAEMAIADWLKLPQIAKAFAEMDPEGDKDDAPPSHALLEGDNITDPNAWRSVNELVRLLLHPPYNVATNHEWSDKAVRVNLRWVMRVIHEGHFRYNADAGRPVLRDDSKLKTHGLVAGLPETYWNWLVGGSEPKVKNYPEQDLFMSKESFSKAQTALASKPATY